MMQAGKLRDRVGIENPATVSDGAGGATTTWVNVATVWANITLVNARENRAAEQRAEKITHKITLRYRDDINATMRLVSGARIFEIEAITNEDERDHWLVCRCVEGLTA